MPLEELRSEEACGAVEPAPMDPGSSVRGLFRNDVHSDDSEQHSFGSLRLARRRMLLQTSAPREACGVAHLGGSDSSAVQDSPRAQRF